MLADAPCLLAAAGDTVNTASRCESNSEPGRVTMSEAAADAVREQTPGATVVSRGLVAIKGKGMQPLFFLQAVPPSNAQTWRKDASSRAVAAAPAEDSRV